VAKPRIIFFDLETLPNLNEALKVWCSLSQYPFLNMKAQITSVINFGYKVYGEKKSKCINAWDFPEWKRNVNNDKKLVKAAYEILKDADAVVTHNGSRFDWKFLQTRLLFHGLPPLGKIHHIDTCQVAKRNLYAFNNKLGNLGEFFVNDKKLAHTGWQLWVDVHGRNKKAMKLMEKYCKQDVDLLEKVFEEFKPFIKNIPNYNIFNELDKSCPTCGSTKIKSNGWRITATQKYRRYICHDCKSWFRTDTKDRGGRTY